MLSIKTNYTKMCSICSGIHRSNNSSANMRIRDLLRCGFVNCTAHTMSILLFFNRKNISNSSNMLAANRRDTQNNVLASRNRSSCRLECHVSFWMLSLVVNKYFIPLCVWNLWNWIRCTQFHKHLNFIIYVSPITWRWNHTQILSFQMWRSERFSHVIWFGQ